MGKWMEKSICGRTGRGFVGGDRREVAAYCGRKTQSVVQQLQFFTLVRQLRQLCKKQQKITQLSSRNLQPLCWTKGDGGDLMQFYKDFF